MKIRFAIGDGENIFYSVIKIENETGRFEWKRLVW